MPDTHPIPALQLAAPKLPFLSLFSPLQAALNPGQHHSEQRMGTGDVLGQTSPKQSRGSLGAPLHHQTTAGLQSQLRGNVSPDMQSRERTHHHALAAVKARVRFQQH